MMRFFLKISMLCCFGLVLCCSGCHSSSDKDDTVKQQIVTVEKKTPDLPLYYRGVIEPIKIFSVVSPFDGRLTELHFHYGDTLKKGGVIAAMSSLQLSEDFKKVVTEYLSKKSAYYNAREDFAGVKMLYQAGVSSKSDFLSSQSSFQNDALSYMQSKFELETLLHKIHIDPREIEKLSLADQDQLAPLLTKQFDHIDIKATGSGVALFPIDQGGDTSSDDISDALHVGSKLSEGQLMLSIGDLSGLSVDLVASEDSINRLHPGMPATITSDAFPGIHLQGKVSSVSLQAEPNASGGRSLSQFPLHVIVPTVSSEDLVHIKVGMTCKVQLNIVADSALMVPLSAVVFDGHHAIVRQRLKDGTIKKVIVVTGLTTPSEVVIVSGLKAGDQVLMND